MTGPETKGGNANGGNQDWSGVSEVEFRGGDSGPNEAYKEAATEVAEGRVEPSAETKEFLEGVAKRKKELAKSYPQMDGETDEKYAERLDWISTEAYKAEKAGEEKEAEDRYQASAFGAKERRIDDALQNAEQIAQRGAEQQQEKAERIDTKYLDMLDRRVEEGKTTREEADDLLTKHIARQERQAESFRAETDEKMARIRETAEAGKAEARQDYADRQVVGTPEEQKRYEQFFRKHMNENLEQLERREKLTPAEQEIVDQYRGKKTGASEAKVETGQPNPEEVAKAVEEIEGSGVVGEAGVAGVESEAGAEKTDGTKTEAGKAEDAGTEAGKAEDAETEAENAPKTEAEKAAEKQKEELQIAEIMEKGKEVVPDYMQELWKKACDKYELYEMQGITKVLEALQSGNREEAMKMVKEDYLDDGFIMGAVALFRTDGIQLINDALTEVYGAPNEHNQKYLARMQRYHDREMKGVEARAEAGAKAEAGASVEAVDTEAEEETTTTKTGETTKAKGERGEEETGFYFDDAFVQERFGAILGDYLKPGMTQKELEDVTRQATSAKKILDQLENGGKLSERQMTALDHKGNKIVWTILANCSPEFVEAMEGYYNQKNGNDSGTKWRGSIEKFVAGKRAKFEAEQAKAGKGQAELNGKLDDEDEERKKKVSSETVGEKKPPTIAMMIRETAWGKILNKESHTDKGAGESKLICARASELLAKVERSNLDKEKAREAILNMLNNGDWEAGRVREGLEVLNERIDAATSETVREAQEAKFSERFQVEGASDELNIYLAEKEKEMIKTKFERDKKTQEEALKVATQALKAIAKGREIPRGVMKKLLTNNLLGQSARSIIAHNGDDNRRVPNDMTAAMADTAIQDHYVSRGRVYYS